MAIAHPTHVVTVGVWEPASARSTSFQCWVTAGPFDDPEDIGSTLLVHLGTFCDAVEVIDRRVSQHRPSTPPWEQLSLLVDVETRS